MDRCRGKCDCFYKLLRLSRPISLGEKFHVNSAEKNYKKLMILIHPDKTNDTKAHVTAILLNTAIRVLREPVSELRYRNSGAKSIKAPHRKSEINLALCFINDCLKDASLLAASPSLASSSSFSIGGELLNKKNGLGYAQEYQSHGEDFGHNKSSSRSADSIHGRRLEAITGHRYQPRKVIFTVKWEGYTREEHIGLNTLMINDRDRVEEYLFKLESESQRKLLYLLKREPSLWQFFFC